MTKNSIRRAVFVAATCLALLFVGMVTSTSQATPQTTTEVGSVDTADGSTVFVGRVATSSGASLLVRSGPGTSYDEVGSIGDGESAAIFCQRRGDTVSGPFGSTDLWDKVGDNQYVSDAYMFTGSDTAVAPDCLSSPSPRATEGAWGTYYVPNGPGMQELCPNRWYSSYTCAQVYAAGHLAQNWAEEDFGPGSRQSNGEANAFLHASWAALAWLKGGTDAYDIVVASENRAENVYATAQMDLYNDQMGRDVAMEVSMYHWDDYTEEVEIRKWLLEMATSGQLEVAE